MSLIDTPVAHRLDVQSHGAAMDAHEFDAVTDWDRDYQFELIHGVVVVSPITSEGEAGPNDELAFLLRQYRNKHPAGNVIDDTLPERYVHLLDGSRRRADRVVWAGLGRTPDPKIDVPAIVIEFVSRSHRDRRRDYVEKREESRTVGVKEYWVIDRFESQMSVYSIDGSERMIHAQETYQTPLLPGFELPLGRLIAIANRWP